MCRSYSQYCLAAVGISASLCRWKLRGYSVGDDGIESVFLSDVPSHFDLM